MGIQGYTVPAIYFSALDIWILLFQTFPKNNSWELLIDKTTLSIAHGTSSASAQLGIFTDEKEKIPFIRAEVSLSGVDYNEVEVVLERKAGSIQLEERIGAVDVSTPESNSVFYWKPKFADFNSVLVTGSEMSPDELGKYIYSSEPKKTWEDNPGMICDGSWIEYSIKLVGHRHMMQQDHESTGLVFH